MDIESLRAYYLSKKGVTEETPFGPDALVYKVLGKMWAIISLTRLPLQTSLKCDPDRARQLREDYEGILPGWHLNKQHWNTVHIESDVSDNLLIELTDHSYDLVRSKLTKRQRQALLDDEQNH